MTKTEYLLIQLISECVEVAHRATKALHFGLNETEPLQDKGTNKERLQQELTDLMATVEMLHEDEAIVDMWYSREAIRTKKEKVERYMKYSASLGIAEDFGTTH